MMKPNVKIVMKVDGKVFMEENLTVANMEILGLICDEINECIGTFEQVGTVDGPGIEYVEPTFRADK